MTQRGLGLVHLVFAFACTAPEAQPSTQLDVTLDLTAVAETVSESDAPLRAAIVWMHETSAGLEARVSWDQPVRDRARMQARFSIPIGVEWSQLRPTSSLRVPVAASSQQAPGSETLAISGYRPRVIVYADGDGDGEFHFDPKLASGAPTDRGDAGAVRERSGDWIVAIDYQSGGILALEDPRATLAELPPSTAYYYYQYAPGFSHFVFVESGGGALVLGKAAPLKLTTYTHARNHFELSCGRSLSPSVRVAPPEIKVDVALDLASICGLDAPLCESVELDLATPIWRAEELESQRAEVDESGRAAQCKRGGNLEALLVRRWAMSCANCACTTEVAVEIHVAERGALPAWWPCGDELGYCRTGTLREFVAECPLEPLQPASDASAEAGALGSE